MPPADRAKIEAACAAGWTSINSTGSSPGFISEAGPGIRTTADLPQIVAYLGD